MQILVVEDSPEVSLITVEFLNELGHEAVAVTDAELAVEQLVSRHFDAVLTDVSLPGMSGIDLAKTVVKKFPKVPVVISSGYGMQNVHSLLGQPEDKVFVLSKPYDMDMLEKTLLRVAASARG